MNTNPTIPPEVMEAVLNTHRVAGEASSKSVCECGQKLQAMFFRQGLGYDKEQKCMCDFVTYHCVAHDPKDPQTCQHTKVFSVPLKGKMYDEMAQEAQVEKQHGIVGEMELSEEKGKVKLPLWVRVCNAFKRNKP